MRLASWSYDPSHAMHKTRPAIATTTESTVSCVIFVYRELLEDTWLHESYHGPP
jgi:hypothetical protein